MRFQLENKTFHEYVGSTKAIWIPFVLNIQTISLSLRAKPYGYIGVISISRATLCDSTRENFYTETFSIPYTSLRELLPNFRIKADDGSYATCDGFIGITGKRLSVDRRPAILFTYKFVFLKFSFPSLNHL